MNKIENAYKDIMPTFEEKEKMLDNILPSEKEKLPVNKKFILPAAIAAAIALAVVVSPMMNNNDNVVVPAESAPEIAAPAPMPPQPPVPSSSPMMGMRKFLNYNNCRYEFLDNGKVFNEEDFKLGEKLGTLTNDITSDPAAIGKLDLSTTFALGSDIYSLEDYDPSFRIAVKGEEWLYICQNVDNSDGSDVDIKAFLEKSALAENTSSIDIYDHFEREVLNSLNEEKSKAFIEELMNCQNIKLENEDYEKIARSQSEGKSFRLVLNLNDGTTYKMYVIPQMEIAMIGDNKYLLPSSFGENFNDEFENLKVLPPVMN